MSRLTDGDGNVWPDTNNDTPDTRLRQQIAKITGCDIDKDGDFIDWSYEGGRLTLSKREVDQLAALCQEIAREAQKQLLDDLANTGEIHHSVFDYRLEELTQKPEERSE